MHLKHYTGKEGALSYSKRLAKSAQWRPPDPEKSGRNPYSSDSRRRAQSDHGTYAASKRGSQGEKSNANKIEAGAIAAQHLFRDPLLGEAGRDEIIDGIAQAADDASSGQDEKQERQRSHCQGND